LSKPKIASNGRYSVLPYNYGYFFQSLQPTPIFQTDIGGLTHSRRCFTPKKLEKQRKTKVKEVVDLSEEINKPVIE
jgi:hypothetical protein